MLIQDLTPTELEVCVMLYRHPRSIVYNQELGHLIPLEPDEKGNYKGNTYYLIASNVINSLADRGLLTSYASSDGKEYLVLDTAKAENAPFINELAVQIALGSI